MLEFEIEIAPGLAGDLATRVMALWPGLEVKTYEESVRFRLPLDKDTDTNLQRLEKALQALEKTRALDPVNVKIRNLTGPDSGPKLLRRGRFVIRRPGVEVQAGADQIVLTLEPGLAFGTGGHPSTSLTLAAMDEYFNPQPGSPSRSGARVLDVGTGSGILALAAARLGAGPILAVDSSHEAAETAPKNAALNGVASKITVSRTTLDKVSGEFDLILANLVPAVLVRAGKKLPRLLAPEGTMIVAGFADSQTPQIVKAMTKAGLVIIKSYSQAGWAALTFSRPA